MSGASLGWGYDEKDGWDARQSHLRIDDNLAFQAILGQ
jgi:hypothetical protein